MNWVRNKQQWRDYLLITLGSAIMAVATSSIYDPAGLVTGGFSGLAIVVKQLSLMLFGKGVRRIEHRRQSGVGGGDTGRKRQYPRNVFRADAAAFPCAPACA